MANLDVGAAVNSYRATRPNLASLEQAEFQKISSKDEVVFTVDETSPVLDFGPPTGLSSFKAFELPAEERDYVLVLRSYMFSDGYPAKAQAFFYPSITLLDEQKRKVLTTGMEQSTYITSSMADEPSATHRIQVSVPIQTQARIRYAVVHTVADKIGSRQQFQGLRAGLTVPLAGGGFASVPAGSGTYSAVGSPIAPPGSLKLRIAQPNG